MKALPRLPLIEDLTKGPIPPGSNILVEFDPASQWYNASFTIAAGWIRSGGVASYNAQAQPPENARLQLKRLGLDTETLEKEEKLRILDWYTTQLGQKPKEKYANTSLKVADLSLLWSKEVMRNTGSPYSIPSVYHRGPHVLIIADDELVLLRFNDEKSFIQYWCTRVIPSAPARQSTQIVGAVKGVYS